MEQLPVWANFISLGFGAVGVIGLLVTVYFRFNPRRGNLTFFLKNVTSFHEMADNIQKSFNLPKGGDLKIILDTNNKGQSEQSAPQDLTDVTVLNYRIQNSSRVPVQSDEIKKLALQTKGDILAAYPTEKDSDDLEFSVTTNDSDERVELDLKGLDKGEWVEFEVLIKGDFSQDEVEIQERTVGVDVKKPREKEKLDSTLRLQAIAATALMTLFISTVAITGILDIQGPIWLVFDVLVVPTIALVTFDVMYNLYNLYSILSPL